VTASNPCRSVIVPADAAVQQQAEPVIGEVSEPEPGAFNALDEQVHRFGRAVGSPASAEVGEQLVLPGGDGAPEPFEFGYAWGCAGLVEGVQPAPSPIQVRGGVEVPRLLAGNVGGGDLTARVTGIEAGEQPAVGLRGQVLRAALAPIFTQRVRP
jgi:hypothetical protein